MRDTHKMLLKTLEDIVKEKIKEKGGEYEKNDASFVAYELLNGYGLNLAEIAAIIDEAAKEYVESCF